MELLAPAGNREKLETAYHFGADACYAGGKSFSLRAFAGNFDADELKSACEYAHSLGKKLYVAVNIFPYDSDFDMLENYFRFLESIKIDAAIITDPGAIALCRQVAPNLPVHISTQANVLNARTAEFWAKQGAERIILARELSLSQIKEIRDRIPSEVQLECFVHGAMCISYSGRCLLSSYLSNRNSNKGECVQSCRWNYEIREVSREGDYFPIQQDDRGSYILNSKDLNMLSHIKDLIDAGVYSFKIEGRMKTPYYVATVTNAYRRAIDAVQRGETDLSLLEKELTKCKGRGFTTGFFYPEHDAEVTYDNSQTEGEYDFIAKVIDCRDGFVEVEQRNRFFKGDFLEVLSRGEHFNYNIKVEYMSDVDGVEIDDAKIVQQRVFIKTPIKLERGDLLRRKRCK